MIRPPGPGADAGQVARHYEDLDRYYRELWGEHVHHGLWESGSASPAAAVEALVHRVADVAAIGRGSVVLDVGCGYGGTARLLARRYGARVTGVTLSAAQGGFGRAAVQREGLEGEVRIEVGDWLGAGGDAAREQGPFDVVLAVESMTHMADLDGALRRVASALRPGGRFVACVWLAGNRVGGLQQRHLLEPICREGRLVGLPTADEFVAAMVGAGLTGPVLIDDLSDRVRATWDHTLGAAARRVVEDPDARRFLTDSGQTERVFALTMLRIWLAYRTGALRYGLFTGSARPRD